MRKTMALLIVAVCIGGCQQNAVTGLDPDRILHMAGEEAGLIGAPKERLTRQLNISNRESSMGRKADARVTLGKARETLEKAEKNAFNDQERLAGWISLSELARYAEDRAFANSALDQAMAALDQVTPQQERCQYVLGVERELRELRGDPAAAKLLVTAGNWAMEIPAQPMRRQAYLAFSRELFRCNDYEGARAVLRKDQDAAWRSDALMAMSDNARIEGYGQWSAGAASYKAAKVPVATVIGDERMPLDSGVQVSTPFGKQLDFKNNYYRP